MNASGMLKPQALLLYCRAGFEKDCAQEILTLGAAQGVYGYANAKDGQAWVMFVPHEPAQLAKFEVSLAELVFARQLLWAGETLKQMPTGDRVTPLVACAHELSRRYAEVWCETADTNEAKELSSLARAITGPLAHALREQRMLVDDAKLPRLHVFFTGTDTACVAAALPDNRSDWPMGIPRLKMPRGAPSRSTLKLHEAFLTLLTEKETRTHLQPGMKAVDLGAAPGGWTWQLVQRHMHVTAIDNAKLDPRLLETGQVKHRQEDGFRYRPPVPVDWVVCDMVAPPSRIAALMAEWIAEGHAKNAMFNLKLPMKKRIEELERCRDLIEERLSPRDYVLRIKQLYHDREEVTAYLRLEERRTRRRGV